MTDIVAAQALSGSVLLAGDFNARTGTLQDFVARDEHADVPGIAIPGVNDLPSQILPRRSTDREVHNQFGKRLLTLCQDASLLILNGRVEGDALGQCTCHTHMGSSLVDYFVCTPSMLALQPHLEVDQLPPDSDHCPLFLTLPTSPTTAHSSNAPLNSLRKLPRLRYRSNRVDAFRASLADSLSSKFDSLPSQSCQAVALTECIASTAAQVHGFCTAKRPMHRHQPWYDEEVKSIRQQLRVLPRSCNEYVELQQQYRRTKQRKRRQYTLQCQQKMCWEACHNAAAFWRKYKKRADVVGQISTEDWRSAFQNLFGPQVESSPEVPLLGTQGSHGVVPQLNVPVTVEEVDAAFKRLKRRKASGIDGIKAEYLLDAKDLLLEPLTAAFNQMLVSGVPQSWCSGVIHPIFKSGDVSNPSNYRGITVTSVLAKLFAMVLEARLSNWAEDSELRAHGQAGFRKDYRTTDNVFVLQTLIAHARKTKKKLYCCFVDFKKAFDSVPRQRLWEVLGALGIQGDILACLKSAYEQDEASVLTKAGLTEAFRCTAGVKQGCPASPLLFGLFIDELEARLEAGNDLNDAPELLGTLIAVLLFADDIALMSHSPSGLQHQLSILAQFCADRGLTVNTSKTKVVIFEPRHTECQAFTFLGQTIERVDVFKYLGIAFHATRGLSCAMEQLCSAARKALFALFGRCHEMRISCPVLKRTLFDALVRPVLSYCCEIWVILGGKGALQCLEQVYIQFLRQLLGVPSRTSSKLVYAEFGTLPLKHGWLQQCLRYLSRLQQMSEHRLCKVAFQADMRLGLGWFAGLKDVLREYDIRIPRSLGELDLVTSCRTLKDTFILRGMTAEPHNHLQSTYFSFKSEYRCEPYITQSKSQAVRSTIARFRTGCHDWLQVGMGRYRQVDHEERRCPSCPDCVEDEMHAIFHCPSYSLQRLLFEDLFDEPQSLRSFIVENPPHRVAAFLKACRNVRLNGPQDCAISSEVADDYDSS